MCQLLGLSTKTVPLRNLTSTKLQKMVMRFSAIAQKTFPIQASSEFHVVLEADEILVDDCFLG